MRFIVATRSRDFDTGSFAQQPAQQPVQQPGRFSMPFGLDATCAAVRRESAGLALEVDGDGRAIGVVEWDVERGGEPSDVPAAGWVS